MHEDDFDDLFGSINSLDDFDTLPPSCRNAEHSGNVEAGSIANRSASTAADRLDDDGNDTRVPVTPVLPCVGVSSKAHPTNAGLTDGLTGGSRNIVSKVEAVFEEIADAILNERDQASILLKRRPTIASRAAQRATKSGGHNEQPDGQRICFPGRTEREAWRFAVLTRLLELIHQALREGTVLSKRDIYYRDPALFGKQEVVDRYIDDIAFTFGVPRSSLSITAAAKGLIVGAVTLWRRDGTSSSALSDNEGILVPSLHDILSVDMSSVSWILVIEKEATFRSILASPFWTSACSTGVLITAKGYPDIATRAMLRFLTSPSPQNGFAAPAVHCLVDFDPDGLAILSTYKHGSNSLAHESGELKVPQIQWLGLRSQHVTAVCTDANSAQGLLALSPRDRRKARKMLSWPALQGDYVACSELQRMLMLNLKAELQLLDATAGAMDALLVGAQKH